MKGLEYLITKYTLRYDSKIKKITDPLKTSFGITEFLHYTIRRDGTFSYLANHPEISDHYWGSHLYKMCPLFRHPDQLQSFLMLSNALSDNGYHTSQGEIQKKFNMQLPFLIALKRNGTYHGFGFSTRDPNFPLDSVCVNHLPRLNKFCDYFVEETSLIERELLDERFNIGEMMGSSFHEPIPPLSDVHINLRDFYKKLKRENRVEIKLSNRERECLSYFLQGNACREIGEKLNLSPRTIEAYFVAIKGKLNCHTKSELFQCVQELEQFGLL